MRRFITRKGLLLLAGVLALALAALALLPRAGGVSARLTFENGSCYTIPLSPDALLHYDDGALPVTLLVEGGRIRFADSQCPDHLCEGFGWLSGEGQIAVCAPAGALLEILTNEN